MRPKKVSDEDILQTVRRCLVEQGGSVSTQFIADQVGVSQATLFKRFGSKQSVANCYSPTIKSIEGK